MRKNLGRLLEEIRRTEEKIAEWQAYLENLNKRKKQLEDEEIIRSIRSMKLQSRDLLDLLTGMQEGTVSFQYDAATAGPDPEGDKAEPETDHAGQAGQRDQAQEGGDAGNGESR